MKTYYYKKTVKIPIYAGVVKIVLSNDNERIKKEFPEDYNDGDYAFAHTDQINEYFLVLIFDVPRSKITISTAAHESLHITNFILRDKGVVADWDNDECQTYLLGFVLDKVLEFARDKKIKIE